MEDKLFIWGLFEYYITISSVIFIPPYVMNSNQVALSPPLSFHCTTLAESIAEFPLLSCPIQTEGTEDHKLQSRKSDYVTFD